MTVNPGSGRWVAELSVVMLPAACTRSSDPAAIAVDDPAGIGGHRGARRGARDRPRADLRDQPATRLTGDGLPVLAIPGPQLGGFVVLAALAGFSPPSSRPGGARMGVLRAITTE